MIRNILRKRAAKKSHIARLGQDGANFLPQLRAKEKNELVSISVSGYSNRIYLRNKTSDIPTFYQCIFNKEYDVNFGFIPSTILDLGANIGLTTSFFKSKYPNAKVVAVEPENGNFELLEKNTSDLSNVIRYKAGVWNKKVHLEIDQADSGNYGFTVKEIKEPTITSMPALSIIDIMIEQNISIIDVLKMDIEGSELQLFDSSSDLWLPHVRVLIIELHDRINPGCAQTFFKTIGNYKFRFELMGENLVLFFDNPTNRDN